MCLMCERNVSQKILFYTQMIFTADVIDSEPHLSRTCQTSLLFAPLTVLDHTGCSAFPFNSTTKPLIQLYIKYINVLFPQLEILF